MGDRDSDQFGFERLEVWRRAVDLANSIYGLTRQFPREEMFGMTMQLRRAGISIAANIAEGASRASGKDQARFFEMAYGSANEVVAICHVALAQGFIDEPQVSSLREDAARVCRMLSGLRRSAMERGGVPKP